MISNRGFMEEDYHNFMEFYKEMYIINQNQDCWLPARWEYAANFVNKFFISLGYDSWDNKIRVWEENNKIVAIAQIEDTNCGYLQIRPGYYHITEEMVTWLEEHGSMSNKDTGTKDLILFSREDNEELNRVLEQRGYKKSESFSYMSRMKPEDHCDVSLSKEFKIKSMAENIPYYKRYNVVRKAFNPEFEEISNDADLPEFFLDMINAPMYRAELDLVIECNNGDVVAACTVWYDESINIGMIEPVGTHPDYHGKGLGKAIVTDALKRLAKLSADYAYVESFGDVRNQFYSSVGFKSFNKDIPWKISL